MRNCVVSILSVLAMLSASIRAYGTEYTDQDIKRQFAKAGRYIHAEDVESNYDLAFQMSGNDTNRYVRVLCELAAEKSNQTARVLQILGLYKTPASLPFLYSYATNATYGADALKSVFAIEGATSNSVAVAQGYLSLTNESVLVDRGGAIICAGLVRSAKQEGVSVDVRTNALAVAYAFATTRNRNYYWLDNLLMKDDSTYRYSKRRLNVLRSADLQQCPYHFQVNYITNAINELVAYPVANLPD